MTEIAGAFNSGRTKLHISPFSSALLDTVLPRSKQNSVSSISYHQTQSDPDRGFGFLELPTEEADRLRKKLHGAILRGTKMSIETARPEKRKAGREDGAEAENEPARKKAATRSKKVKSKSVDEIIAVELPKDRKVKRGWTDAKAAKDDSKKTSSTREKSRYTDKDEVLFRTGKAERSTKADTKAGKKTKNADKGIIHEFERTAKVPTFLKQEKTGRDGALTFVEGQGWVDEAGNLVEPVRSSRRAAANGASSSSEKIATESALGIKGIEENPTAVLQSATSSSEEVSSESSISSDSSSDDSDAEDESKTASPVARSTPVATVEDTLSTPVTAPSTNANESSDSATGEMLPPKDIHPLEALYKRRLEDVPRPAPIQTSFSFFGGAEEAEPAPLNSSMMPQTPFTQQDIRTRVTRSAAPTPDTAAAPRIFFPNVSDDIEEDNEQTSTPVPETSQTVYSGRTTRSGERSAIVEEFYARRSELNQSWKQRRRDAMKQERQRENKRLTRRAL